MNGAPPDLIAGLWWAITGLCGIVALLATLQWNEHRQCRRDRLNYAEDNAALWRYIAELSSGWCSRGDCNIRQGSAIPVRDPPPRPPRTSGRHSVVRDDG